MHKFKHKCNGARVEQKTGNSERKARPLVLIWRNVLNGKTLRTTIWQLEKFINVLEDS